MRKMVNDSLNLTERTPWRKVLSSVSSGEMPIESDQPDFSPLQINKGEEDMGSEDLPRP